MSLESDSSLHGKIPGPVDRSSLATARNGDFKKALYERIVEQAYWLGSTATHACRKGCSLCCTQSVTMTTFEGERILAYILSMNTDSRPIVRDLLVRRQDTHAPQMTTNQFARFCLEGRDDADWSESQAIWNFAQCQFLANGSCTIYPARPFACRAMVSQKTCGTGGAAEMTPVLVTLNSIWLQLIEHIDTDGFWGNMFDVLALLTSETAQGAGRPFHASRLLRNQALPGFLIPPTEQAEATKAIAGLFQTTIDGLPFSSLLKRAEKG